MTALTSPPGSAARLRREPVEPHQRLAEAEPMVRVPADESGGEIPVGPSALIDGDDVGLGVAAARAGQRSAAPEGAGR